LTTLNRNDIFLKTMEREILTNKITPVLCVNSIFNLRLDIKEETAVADTLENMLKVKNVVMASLFRRAYDEAVKRRENLS